MKLIIKEEFNNEVYRDSEESKSLQGIRLYLGQDDEKLGGLFIETGKLLKQLWNADDEHYDDINYFLSKLEYLLDVPDLDYKNSKYNFAFKKSAITPEIREIIDDLDYYLNELGYEVIEETVDVTNIEYEDDIQFAYKINENSTNKGTSSKAIVEFDSDYQELTLAQTKYFKNSKVRNSNGQLYVCYHGTSHEFNTFDTASARWFTPNVDYAEVFGNKYLLKVYLNITKPLYLGDIDDYFWDEDNYDEINDTFPVTTTVKNIAKRLNIDVQLLIDIFERYDYTNNVYRLTNSPEFKQLAVEHGFDGLQAEETCDITFGIFDANQVKLVTNLNPTSSSVINEATERYNGMIFTDSPYTIRDYCINRPNAYRILYDANIDLYMLCDASLHIHWDLINQAYDLGFYSELKTDETIDEVIREYIADRDLFNYTDIGCDGFYDNGDDCIELGQYLMYAIWVPKGMTEDEIENSPSSDGYDDEFEFPAGSLFTRGLDTDLMNRVDLINILRRSQPAKLTESVSETFLAKLTSAWSKDTCHPAYVNKWTEQNPAAGQCLVTALAVQDEYGGDIYDCKVGHSRHFYNVVNDEIVDLTFNQFPEGSEIKDKRKRDRKQLLANKETKQRYELLKSKMGETKQMTEAFNSKQNAVELEYVDLPITIQTSMDRDGQWNEREILKDFTLLVDKEDIITKIFEDCITDEDILGGLNGFSDEAIEQFIRNNFETLFDKYYDKLLDFYMDDAIEACEEAYGWDDYEADEHDDYADFLYDQWRDSQFESVKEKSLKLTITEDWNNSDTEFIDYVLNQFNEFLKTWPVKPYNRDSDLSDVDTLISRFLTKGLTEEKVQQVINDVESYLDYSGVELDDIDLNYGSIWDWTDKYTHYLIVEQNFAEVLDTVGYEKAKELVQAWKQNNEIKSDIKTENLINRKEPPYYNFNEFWFFVARYWFDCDAERSALKDAFDYGMSHPEATFSDCPVFYDRYYCEGECLELAFKAGQESADFII